MQSQTFFLLIFKQSVKGCPTRASSQKGHEIMNLGDTLTVV